MKRFHIHLHVEDLAKNIAFYSAMFNAEPARSEADYAKWMLEDPPLNFAISTRGEKLGVDHLGIQVDSPDDLAELNSNATRADMLLKDEGQTSCCYARSNKYWVSDPQGVAWEQFHTLASIPVFSEATKIFGTAPCCASTAATAKSASLSPSSKACC